MAGEYNAYRRVPKVPKVERAQETDKTQVLDKARKARFEAALARTSDALREDDQKRRHHTYADAERRFAPAKKKP